MDVISIEQINERRKLLDFKLLKVNVQLPMTFLQKEVTEILDEYAPVLKDGYKTYSGVGLQYFNPDNPIYDCVEQTFYIKPDGHQQVIRNIGDRDFINKNQLAKRLSVLFEIFKDIPLYRGRILRANPGHIHSKHIDGAKGCRLHIPIFSNEKSRMCYDDTSFHLEADGSAYICNTGIPHNFENLGDTDRIHIVFVL